ncbi:YHS domain-containing protein [Microbulbifer yueqingensis]|uniref:YHS domain-containing protein n=1 Tax=Microbulbifer yueqingensis TaxID=658219 RepID=A0A1G8ZTT0_9GAMM|nr:YHS domain-containing protein [Microbulbifer yueqingensis]SDK18529.1 YHS domain-containing protein [Microbulbifer yueqingensis]
MTRSLLGATWDPVCGEMVPEGAHSWTHRHIKYSFCSDHCRERFQRWPHLYVGEATFGLAEGQLGTSVPKSHTIVLAEAPSAEEALHLSEALAALKGVDEVRFDGERALVHYDLMQVSLADIEKAIITEAGGLRQRISDRVERALIHYSEECELDNLSHLAAHYRP